MIQTASGSLDSSLEWKELSGLTLVLPETGIYPFEFREVSVQVFGWKFSACLDFNEDLQAHTQK